MRRMLVKRRRRAYIPKFRRIPRGMTPVMGEKALIAVGGLLIALLLILLVKTIFGGQSNQKYIPTGDVAAFRIQPSALTALYTLSEKYGIVYTELLAVYAIDNGFFPQKDEKAVDEIMLEKQYIMKLDQLKSQYPETQYGPYYQIIRDVFGTARRFPIQPEYTGDDYMYGDSFGAAVEFDGKSAHYAADILDRENLAGRMAVLSMADGIVEEAGWRQDSGYFTSIRCQNGVHYQYSHMDSLAAGLSEGATITAGQTLGAMGNTGGSKREGAADGGPARLCIAIAPETTLGGKPFWFNPYPVLRFTEALGRQ